MKLENYEMHLPSYSIGDKIYDKIGPVCESYGKTVLVIAHRMRTIEAADQIVVLDKGVVAESGNHDTLMNQNGLYRKLVDLQTEAANWKLV